MKKVTVFALVSINLLSCNPGKVEDNKTAIDLLASHLDTTVSPGEDFFFIC